MKQVYAWIAGPADRRQHSVQKAAAQMGLDPVQDRQLRRLHGLSPSHLRPVRRAVFVQHHITDLPQAAMVFSVRFADVHKSGQNFPYFCPRPLTSPGERGRILQNWIAQIEARRPSVPHRQGQAAAGRERVRRRSAEMMPVLSVLGRQGIPAGLSQTFVKRYRWLFGAPRRGSFPYFPWTA